MDRREKVDQKIIQALHTRAPASHKGDNGRLLIIGGSKRYHGALLLAVKIASKIVDLVYVSTVTENNALIRRLKSNIAEFITIERSELLAPLAKTFWRTIDAVLIGPGLGTDHAAQELTNKLLRRYPRQKFVLDADALKIVDKKLLGANFVLMPHQNEFEQLFRMRANKANTRKAAKKHNCIIVLKGKKDFIASPRAVKFNTTGNAGMTKGGTGDVLAGLIAALSCKNNLFLAACAGTYVNGKAGDCLKKKVSFYFSASDLIKEIPKILAQNKSHHYA